MKNLFLFLCLFHLMILTESCANRKVKRIDPNQQTDISGRWNDTDLKLVANEMITDVLSNAWRKNFETKFNRKPVVIVGSVRNKTSEYIDATMLIKMIERAFINSQAVGVVQRGDDRNQLREERNDQQTFSSEESKKKWGKEKGADYMLNGVITSIVDEYKKQKTVAYQINLELTDLETNEIVWIGDKPIKKYIKN